MKILRCIVCITNLEIAKTLGVTVYTIKNQVSVILGKLKANNRAHAVTLAMQKGIISLSEVKLT